MYLFLDCCRLFCFFLLGAVWLDVYFCLLISWLFVTSVLRLIVGVLVSLWSLVLLVECVLVVLFVVLQGCCSVSVIFVAVVGCTVDLL